MVADCFCSRPPKACDPLLPTPQLWSSAPLAWLRAQVGLRDWPPHRDVVSQDRPWEPLPVELWRTSAFHGWSCLSACLPASRSPWGNGGQKQTLPGLAHHRCQQPTEAAGPCLPYTKAPGTLPSHTMFSDWEIVPWAHCTETAPPTPNCCCFIQLLKLSCPGPLGQDRHDPSASSVCVCGKGIASLLP